MKYITFSAALLAALPALAHEMGGPHINPHVDPSVIMAALIASGIALWALVRQR